jgi:hypothetical protein
MDATVILIDNEVELARARDAGELQKLSSCNGHGVIPGEHREGVHSRGGRVAFTIGHLVHWEFPTIVWAVKPASNLPGTLG